MDQPLAGNSCPECAAFLRAVEGIRGPYFAGRKQSGRRLSYQPGQRPARDGMVSVSEDFYGDLAEDCRRWHEHVEEVPEADRAAHLDALPKWLRDVVIRIGFRSIGVDAGVRMAAQLLGVDPRSVYRHGRFLGRAGQ